MEFEDMKKIWDQQNNEMLYAINETALYKQIQTKSRHASRITNSNDVGLIAIMIVTSIILLILDASNIYNWGSVLMMLGVAVYVWIGRIRREQHAQRFDRTMLGELDHAIANVSYEVNRSKTFLWWMIVPIAVPALLNMWEHDAGIWTFLIVLGAFVLSYVVARLGLRYRYLPWKRRLEAIRKKLLS